MDAPESQATRDRPAKITTRCACRELVWDAAQWRDLTAPPDGLPAICRDCGQPVKGAGR